MTSALPAHPDLEHLRREAKRLLRGLLAGDPDALARGNAHAPRLAVALATAQLVVAREHGFGSWAQLRALVERLSCGGIRYDRVASGASVRECGVPARPHADRPAAPPR